MSQTAEIPLCTPQILQNAVSSSVGLLVYYCGLCQQGFTSEADVNKHISQHFASTPIFENALGENETTQENDKPNNVPLDSVSNHSGDLSSEDERGEILSPLDTAAVIQEPTSTDNNTYYILIPQSQVISTALQSAAPQQANTIYINGGTSLADPSSGITLVSNPVLSGAQASNGTTLYQIVQEPQPVSARSDKPPTPDNADSSERRTSTSSVDYQILDNERKNSEGQIFAIPQAEANNRLLLTELPVGTQQSHISLIRQENPDLSHSSFRMSSYNSQMSSHFKKRHICDICNRAFTQRGSLKYHRMLHTGEKPFQCNVCSKSFRIRAPYDAHMDVHNGVRYRCSICLKYYSSRATLRQHLKGQHPNMSHPPISSCGFKYGSINLAS